MLCVCGGGGGGQVRLQKNVGASISDQVLVNGIPQLQSKKG